MISYISRGEFLSVYTPHTCTYVKNIKLLVGWFNEWNHKCWLFYFSHAQGKPPYCASLHAAKLKSKKMLCEIF